MGMFDNAVGNAVPGGNLAKPLVIAAGALILAKWLGGGKDDAPQAQVVPPAPAPAHPATIGASDDGLAAGLGGLLDKLRNAGHGAAADSWVSSGPNQPIAPAQLGPAIGQQTISDIAKRAGVSEQDVINMLSQALPGIVDNLTPNGRVPTQQEVNNWGR